MFRRVPFRVRSLLMCYEATQNPSGTSRSIFTVNRYRKSVSCLSSNSKTLIPKSKKVMLSHCQKRNFWGVDVAFNRVDEERVRLAGPDRAAAEWVLRNGGTIKWTTSSNPLTDYNLLPSTQFDSYKLEEIDVSSTDIIGMGFEHLKDLHHVKRIRMHNCKTCGDDGLSHFEHVAETLSSVEISNCPMITAKGLQSLTKLKNLKDLLLYNLTDVRDLEQVVSKLHQQMPGVDIKTRDPKLT